MQQGVLHNGPPLPALTVGQRNNNYGNLRSNDPFVGKTDPTAMTFTIPLRMAFAHLHGRCTPTVLSVALKVLAI